MKIRNTKKSLLVLTHSLWREYSKWPCFEAIGPNGELLMEYSIYDALEAGFNRVVFVMEPHLSKRFKKMIRAKLNGLLEIEFVTHQSHRRSSFFGSWGQNKRSWEARLPLWAARRKVTEPFLVINANNYYGKQAYQTALGFLGQTTSYFGVLGYPLGQTLSRYGRVDRGVCIQQDTSRELMNIVGLKGVRMDYTKEIEYKSPKGVIKKLDASNIVSTNMFCLTPTFFDLAENMLLNSRKNEKESQTVELSIADVINKGLSNQVVNGQVLEANSDWFGVTYKADWILAKYKIEEKIKSGLYPKKLFLNNKVRT